MHEYLVLYYLTWAFVSSHRIKEMGTQERQNQGGYHFNLKPSFSAANGVNMFISLSEKSDFRTFQKMKKKDDNLIHTSNQLNKKLNKKRHINFKKRKLLSILENKAVKNSKYIRKRMDKDTRWSGLSKKPGEHLGQGLETVPKNDSGNNSTNSLQSVDYEDFASIMEQTFSKDPLRAMVSIAFLMVVLMLAVKLCGLKPVKRDERHFDFHEEVHYVSIHDILKTKRLYLPKHLLSWEKRIQRKFKRKKKRKKTKTPVHEHVVSISDHSEDDLIYSGYKDF